MPPLVQVEVYLYSFCKCPYHTVPTPVIFSGTLKMVDSDYTLTSCNAAYITGMPKKYQKPTALKPV